MHIKHKAQGTNPSHNVKPCQPLQTVWLAWVILMSTPTFAASVYRCGNAYSASNACTEGDAVEIQTHRAGPPSQPSKTSPAFSELKEAQALEKKRLTSERRAETQTPPRVIAISPNKANGIEISTPTESYPTLHRRHAQSPYFTAKDPNAPTKKKSNAKALPSEPN